ncbi:MAG TPA: hypothetical protein VFG20_23305 [Planctomycetaceae bacterium]|jgi:hypothetical protein|nr:hypothetical protein [Planctomycetaceae bacterium]
MGSKTKQLWDVLGPVAPGFSELLAIGVGVIVLIWVTLRVKAYLRDDAARDENPVHLLSQLEEMRREDGLTDEEFRLIKSRLAKAVVANVGTRQPAKTAGGLRGKPSIVSQPAATEPLHGGSGKSDMHGTELSPADDNPGPGSTTT